MAIETTNFVEVAKTNEVTNGHMKGFEVNGKKILIANANNQFYAASNVCPHMHATLSEGQLAGTLITCPRHYSQFDLKDGHVVRWTEFSGVARKLNDVIRSPRPLHVYPVKVEENKIMVDLKSG